jgi:hypothetical protein
MIKKVKNVKNVLKLIFLGEVKIRGGRGEGVIHIRSIYNHLTSLAQFLPH